MKKTKIIVIIVVTIMISLFAYSQVAPLKINNPDKDFKPIDIKQAKDEQDNEMALSFLYNLTKEKHPTGSSEIHEIKDYIIRCLEQMNIDYQVDTQNLDEDFFVSYAENELNNIKKSTYNDMILEVGNEEKLDELLLKQRL